MFDDIIVPLDGSTEAARALGPACVLAHELDIEVRAVAYCDDGDDAALSAAIEEQMRGYGNVARSLLVEPLVGSVGAQLVELLEDSTGSLLTMSTLGRGRSAPVLGSVAADVLTWLPGPVVLVGPGSDPARFGGRGPLVVAIDGSDHANAILPVALAFASAFDYPVEVVSVAEPEAVAEPGWQAPAVPFPIASSSLRAGADGGGAESKPLGTDLRVLQHRDPATALVQVAVELDASLLAMSTTNPVGLRRVRLGSTTSTVVSRAPCPVLTVGPATTIAC